AGNSCEGVNSVDACTVTALDAITAFAVPDPNSSSQSRRFFRVRVSDESLPRTESPTSLRISYGLLKPTLSAIAASHPKRERGNLNAGDTRNGKTFLHEAQCIFPAKIAA